MIPDGITRGDIEAVIWKIDSGLLVVPSSQNSTKHCLVWEMGKHYKHYPPKYLIRKAHEDRYGVELWEFFGGKETNNFLENGGFEIVWNCCKRAPH